MKIAILSNNEAARFFSSITTVDWIFSIDINEWKHIEADGFINLQSNAWEENYSMITMPIFINSVCNTIKHSHHQSNVVRMNGWNGFFQRTNWEVAGELNETHLNLLQSINRNYTITPDEPGFISPRIISMIINEAYFSIEQQVSTEIEIDIAMKLGTNYPKGPFEWKEEIGIQNIYTLLLALYKSDVRYKPSQLLSKEANK